MERRLVGLLGTSAKHILTALERAFRAVALTGFITFILVAVAAEVVAYFLDGHQFPPSGGVNLATAALAVAFGYAAAITVAVEEILRAIIKTIELIVEESEKLAEAAAREGETLLREGGQEALRLGRGAATEAGVLGRGAVHEAETLGRDAAGVVGGVGSAVGSAVGGVASGVGHEVRAVESHLPGHHQSAQSGTTDPNAKG
jgi:hypothetical protein